MLYGTLPVRQCLNQLYYIYDDTPSSSEGAVAVYKSSRHFLDSRSFIVILIPFVKKSLSIDCEEPRKKYPNARILKAHHLAAI